MPDQFDLPQLSKKDYQTLEATLRDAIPRYSTNWTDFNASDPGITLLQLLAWVGDVSLYRLDALPGELYLNFARLIAGTGYADVTTEIETLASDFILDARKQKVRLDGEPVVMDPVRLAFLIALAEAQNAHKIDIPALRRLCVDYLNSPYQAVTAEDFETLAKLVTIAVDPDEAPEQSIARAVASFEKGGTVRLSLVTRAVTALTIRTYPTGAAGTGNSSDPHAPRDSRVKARIWAKINSGLLPYKVMMGEKVAGVAAKFFEPRVMLGTKLDVRRAADSPVYIGGRLCVDSGTDPFIVISRATAAIQAHLNPVTGGGDGQGWPLGRPVSVADLIEPLAGVSGIDRSQPLQMSVSQPPSLELGQSRLGQTSWLGADPRYSQAMLAGLQIDAVLQTWPMQIARHSQLGVDTNLYTAEVG